MEYQKPKRRKVAPDLSSMMYGKIPPQAKQLEDAILGVMMLEKDAFDRVIGILNFQCFYAEANQKIFAAMQGLAMKSQPIDMMSVVEELKFREQLDLVGGPFYVSKLTDNVVSSANIEHHAMIVYQKFVKREIIRISGQLIGEAYDDASGDAFDLLDEAEKDLYALSFKNMGKAYVDSATAAFAAIKHTENMRQRNEDVTGVPSGFVALDRATSGWQNGDLIVLAARPSVGKTAMALNFARNAFITMRDFHTTGVRSSGIGLNVGFFSLEMSTMQLTQRIVAAESGINLEKIMRGKLDDEQMKKLYNEGYDKFAKMGIFIDDTAALSLSQLRTKARRMVSQDNVGLIIIDYLQLMSGLSDENSSFNRNDDISKISRGLKILAKELQVPIIALSQLSREVEKRADKKKTPQLSDLRDSGAIEQDADVVMFIYRPEYYGDMVDSNNDKYNGETHIKIAKHRNGTLETIKLIAELWIQKFVDFDDKKSKKKEQEKGAYVPMDDLPFPKAIVAEDSYKFD